MTEAATQRQLLAILGPVDGLHVERTNTGVAVDPRTGRHVRFGTPGAPDVRLTVAGLAVAIECKSSTGRQSQDQRRWQAAHEAAGGVYLLCRDAVATALQVASIALRADRPDTALAIGRRCADHAVRRIDQHDHRDHRDHRDNRDHRDAPG